METSNTVIPDHTYKLGAKNGVSAKSTSVVEKQKKESVSYNQGLLIISTA